MTSEALEKKIQCGETSRVQFKQQFSSQKEIAADRVAFACREGSDIPCVSRYFTCNSY